MYIYMYSVHVHVLGPASMMCSIHKVCSCTCTLVIIPTLLSWFSVICSVWCSVDIRRVALPGGKQLAVVVRNGEAYILKVELAKILPSHSRDVLETIRRVGESIWTCIVHEFAAWVSSVYTCTVHVCTCTCTLSCTCIWQEIFSNNIETQSSYSVHLKIAYTCMYMTLWLRVFVHVCTFYICMIQCTMFPLFIRG